MVLEVILAAELQQGKAVLRKRNRLSLQLKRYSSVVEHRVPDQVRHEDLQQGCALGHRSRPLGEEVHRTRKRPLGKRKKQRAALLLGGGQRSRQLAKGLRSGARRKMVGVVLRLFFLMQSRNRIG